MTDQQNTNISTIGEAIGEWLVDAAARHLPPDIKKAATAGVRDSLNEWGVLDLIKERTTEAINDREAAELKKRIENLEGVHVTVVNQESVDGWELQEVGCWKCNEFCTAGIQLNDRVYGWCEKHQPIFVAHVEDKEINETNGSTVDISPWFATTVFQQYPKVTEDPVNADSSFIWRLATTESGVAIITGAAVEPDLVAEYPPDQLDLAQMLVTAHNVAMAGERQRFHDLVDVQQQERLNKIDAKLDEINAHKWVAQAAGPSVKILDTTGELIVQLTGAHKAMAERLVTKHNTDLGLDSDV